MDDVVIETHLGNLDRRLTRVQQILPTLATKEDLRSLATKEELRAAVALLATREELREEGERWRRHMTMLIEDQNSKIELLAEHLSFIMSKLK